MSRIERSNEKYQRAAAKEMQRALEADGEKLRQQTGEEHGPRPICETCKGLGEHPMGGGFDCDDCNGWGFL